MISMNNMGDKAYPCLNPLPCQILGSRMPLSKILEELLDKFIAIQLRHLCPKPFFLDPRLEKSHALN